jgi:hypothetical protein
MSTRAAGPAAESFARNRQFLLHSLILALVTFGAAGAAGFWLPAAALPLAVLAAIEAIVVMGAYYGQRDLLQRLVLEPDALRVPAVQRFHERLGGQATRDRLAASITSLLSDARLPHAVCLADRVALVEDELRFIARELATPEIPVHVRSVLACLRLLTHGVESPLFNPGVPLEQLHATLLRIRFGFGRPPAG